MLSVLTVIGGDKGGWENCISGRLRELRGKPELPRLKEMDTVKCDSIIILITLLGRDFPSE